jgi:signal transduction histidine kinase
VGEVDRSGAVTALRSLTARVIVVLALAALIPTVAIGALAFMRTRADLEDEVVRGNLALVRALGAGLDQTLQDARRTVEIGAATWADNRTIAAATDDADGRATRRLLGRLTRDIPVLARLAVVDVDRNVVAGDPLPAGVDLDARSFGGYVGDALFVDGHPRVPLVVQARSRTGELVGFFVAEIDLRFVSDALAQARLGRGARVVVVDGQGTPVARSDGEAPGGPSWRGRPAVDLALGAAAEGHLTTGGTVAVFRNLASYQSLRGVRWAIVLEQPEDEAYALAAATRRTTILVATIALAAALLLGAWLATRLTRPLGALAGRADAIARGDAAGPTVSGPGEIGHLARRIDEMAVRIGERAELQAALARGDRLASVGVMSAQVAHEINNPLTTVLGYAKLLAEDKPDDHPDRAGLDLIAGEAARMKQIVAGLLDYARAGTDGAPEHCDPAAVARHVAALVAPGLRKARVTLAVDVTGAPRAAIDAHALQQILVNLVQNAAQAMPDGGAVALGWATLPGDVAFALDVTDDGPGIPPADRARVFDPFFTTKAAGAGTGLGLAVVKHLVARAGGTVEVADAPAGRGARFRLTLPTRRMDR